MLLILNYRIFKGIIPPRREHSGERAHSEQLQPLREAHQGVGAPVRRHLPVLHRAVQVHRRRGGERVSTVWTVCSTGPDLVRGGGVIRNASLAVYYRARFYKGHRSNKYGPTEE